MSIGYIPPEDVPLSQRDLAILYAALVELRTRYYFCRGEDIRPETRAILDVARIGLNFHETNIGELMERLAVYMPGMR
jgi:hypothetical protein